MRLVADTDGAGVKLIDELDDSNAGALNAYLEVEIPDADMDKWRNALAHRADADDSPINAQDVERYAQDIRDIQRFVEDDSVDLSKSNRVVKEVIDNPEDDGQILGQMLEARRAVHYADSSRDVTVDPTTSGVGEPDLRVGRGSDSDLYVETKMTEGDLDGGLKVKDKIVESDGSFDGIAGDHDEIVEISAQREITDDFNPNTPETETPMESFKQMVKANKMNPDDPPIEKLPSALSDYDNPDMTIRVLDTDGNVVDGGEFSIREVYQEVDNGN